MFIVAQLILLLLASAVIVSLLHSEKRVNTFLLSIPLGFFIALQIASVLLGGDLIDYKFYVHFNLRDTWDFKDFFAAESIAIALAILACPILVYLAGKWIRSRELNFRYRLTALGASLIIMCFEGGVVRNLYDVSRLLLTTDKTFNEALRGLSISPSDFVGRDMIKASKGKNIVVISLESYERGYLSDSLSYLTPHLRALANKLTFFEMAPAPGSTWTAGSIYAELTGLPAYFGSHGNKIFQGATEIRIPGLGSILKRAGYRVTYMLGNKEFSGLRQMLEALEFNVRSDHDFSEEYSISKWGIHDKDLFNEAKKEILSARKSGQPFALFLSTISTHHPDGIYDERMEGLVPKQGSNLEFMAAAVDYLIGDFYEFLRRENVLSNTVFYIFPDHLIMGRYSKVLDKFPSPRGLYLITNAKEGDLSYQGNEKIFQIDLPKIILEGAGVRHNVKFLADFLNGRDVVRFIQENGGAIVALNESSLEREDFKEGISIEIQTDQILTIKSTNFQDTLAYDKIPDSLFELTFDKEMRMTGKQVVDRFTEAIVGNSKLYLKKSDNNLYGLFKRDKEFPGISKRGKYEISFTKDDITKFSQWTIEPIDSTEFGYVTPYQSNNIYLTSTCRGSHFEDRPTEIKMGDNSYKVSRGINVLMKVNGIYIVKNFDTFGDSVETDLFIRLLSTLNRTKDFYAMVVHDSGERQLKSHNRELINLGYDLLATLRLREAYIAYSINGIVSENKGGGTLSISLPVERKRGLRSDQQIQKDACDKSRFIAHAGGMIEGYQYTESLEALNLSYGKGFRLFELDIITTSDSQYVAAHDWKNWATQTGYKGALPPTAATFRKQKIRGKFTPLDMESINLWFTMHKDAILVTDKINKPASFSSQFVDKQRLMMELFTMDAVKEGLAVGIGSAMPSAVIVNGIKGDKIKFLKELNIKHIAVPRYMLEGDRSFFQQLKPNGIGAFVFNINTGDGKDEAYVVLNDMDYVYGLYADKWNFLDRCN